MRTALRILVLVAVPAVAAAAPKGSSPVSRTVTDSLIQVVLGLVLVLLVIVAAAWIMRRFGHLQTAAGGGLRIVGGLSLGPRERAVLIQVGERQILLGVAPGRIQTLHVLDQILSGTPQSAAPAQGFAARLASVLKQGQRP
ncbi:MAG: flagellar biosynthetic protein FliO [Gammaproteobacteria bacterium]|nr:flagellar biosynthetic protein FliO [Gammaproteobacteria bacterium]